MKPHSSSTTANSFLRATALFLALFTFAASACGADSDESGSENSTVSTSPVDDETTTDSTIDSMDEDLDDDETADDGNSTEDGTEDDVPVPGVATYQAAQAEVEDIISANPSDPCILFEASSALAVLPDPETPEETRVVMQIATNLYGSVASIMDNNGIDSAPVRQLVKEIEELAADGDVDLDALESALDGNEAAQNSFDEFTPLIEDCADPFGGADGTSESSDG